ncbi:unnamed protein product [Owenia fusiformis]|uniref:Mitochondrial inner membrane protease subunit n=1 Tax=Owenia fusiformis TaxID=6347 RepID=A0A8J1XUS1_OWEFU|nr:unnamed protein product [Owenia fusiformis]
MARRMFLKTIGAVGYMIQYGCIAHCTLHYIGDFVICAGPSMQPTITDNDILLTNHMTVNRFNVERGDVVIAKSPVNPKTLVCKRVVGLEGDVIRDGFSKHFVPRGHVWLEGDNKDNSTDSRTYGPVPYGLLKSKAFYKIWPVEDMGTLNRTVLTSR